MPSFRGMRVNRGANGAGAGRGDSPYSHINAPVPPPRGSSPRPSGRTTIGSADIQPNQVPDTKAARKANSPKAKAKALKAINKTPLKPSDSAFASDSGFERSQESLDYDSARYAEGRLKKNKYTDIPKSLGGSPGTTAQEQKDRDEDIVGSYVATGKSQYSTEGQKWMKGNSAQTRRNRYG